MKNKNTQVAVGILVALLVIGGLVMFGMKKSGTKETTDDSNLPQAEVIPMVDASTKVMLESGKAKGEVMLSIEGMPTGTTSFEYELAYNTKGDVQQGAIGTVMDVDGESSYEKTICLCSESSGTRRYHELIDDKITVSIKFDTASGPRKFEKEFEL